MVKDSFGKFKFNKDDSIGAAAAEDDREYLINCFYDNGDFHALQKTSDIRCIVVGRTGVGKTALFLEILKRERNAVLLNPEELSLQYLADSNLIQTLESAGVNLSLFYKLLWKHIVCVEMIKFKFQMKNEDDQKTFLKQIFQTFHKDKKKERALNYLLKWGDSFWKNTEYRIKEVTERLEEEVEGKLGADLDVLKTSLGATSSHSFESKAEVVSKAQEIVDKIQIAELNEVVTLLTDQYYQKNIPGHYLIVDRLDENWVDDKVRYKLIKALIENCRDFSRVPGFKLIIALRQDLLERVIRLTREVGFQEEKYRSFYLPIRWTDRQLIELLNLRIKKMISHRYLKKEVSWRDILPKKVGKTLIDDYLPKITLGRPRDLVEFFNCCIQASLGKPEISERSLKIAEGIYSEYRLRSLADEWVGDYPLLLNYSAVLKKKGAFFTPGEISKEEIEGLCLSVATETTLRSDLLYAKALDVAEGRMTTDDFRAELLRVFYKVGLLGLKTSTMEAVSWVFRNDAIIRSSEITIGTRIHICPVFHRVLGITEEKV